MIRALFKRILKLVHKPIYTCFNTQRQSIDKKDRQCQIQIYQIYKVQKKRKWKANFPVCVNISPRYFPASRTPSSKNSHGENSFPSFHSLSSLHFPPPPHMPSACGLILAVPRGSKVTVAMWPVIGSMWKLPILSSWLLFWGTDWEVDRSWFSSSFPICAVISSSSHSAGSASSTAENKGSETCSAWESWKFCRVRDWTVWEWDAKTTKLVCWKWVLHKKK